MTKGNYPLPTSRRLRVYAFDPAASVELETAVINDALLSLPWDRPWEDPVTIGPANEYLEVVDYDFPARSFYEPVDLNDSMLLAQDGLPPSEGCPQFHQQMVFAVAMNTIRNFERALGRYVFWVKPAPSEKGDTTPGRRGYADLQQRLRIYPHAMREANAYYSPDKASLLFGYFKSLAAGAPEGQWVFTCLSQDIVAHETTHAILHGMRRRSIQSVNQDSLALHEGFADIVALLQHFTMGNVVAHELGRNGGKLRSVNLLTGLANQFGTATGRNGALRLAMDTLSAEAGDKGGTIKLLSDTTEAHDRGSVLVAAIFDAFVTIYERRTADLFRLAGVQPGDDGIPQALVTRLASEAGQTAGAMLQMCVRGLDYLPPVGPTFGEYLRAIITADIDLVPEDPMRFRVALAEAFRKRAIPVPGCMSYAPEALFWDPPSLGPSDRDPDGVGLGDLSHEGLFADAMARLELGLQFRSLTPETRRESLSSAGDTPTQVAEAQSVTRSFEDSPYQSKMARQAKSPDKPLFNLRKEAMRILIRNQAALHKWLAEPSWNEASSRKDHQWERLLGIRMLPLASDARPLRSINSGVRKWSTPGSWTDKSDFGPDGKQVMPLFDVHSVRIAHRAGPNEVEQHQLIANITQKRRGYFDEDEQKKVDREGSDKDPDFWFRGGATIIVDLRNGQLQHVIRKRIDDDDRLDEQRSFLLEDDTALAIAVGEYGIAAEPFAFVHGDTA